MQSKKDKSNDPRLEVTVTTDEAMEYQEEQVDRGTRAWTVVAGAWCSLFCSFGWVNGE